MNAIKKNAILLIITLLYVNTFLAQNSISGTINDQTGGPLPGVNVILEGKTLGAVTDFDGNYSINNVENGTYNLPATYMGFKNFSKSITIQGADILVNISINIFAILIGIA